MKITFLGTACMVPTKERNHFGVFVRYKNEGILVDCGENIQRQMKVAGIKPSKITKILISHWHGDHVFGLPGLLKSLTMGNYEGTLRIYGQKGIKEHMKKVFDAFPFKKIIKLEIIEIKKKIFIDKEDFKIEAFKLEHSVPTIGFNFIVKERRKILMNKVKKLGVPDGPLIGKLQKGKDIVWKGKKVMSKDVSLIINQKKLSFIMDTRLCNNIYKFSKDADILICDSTYNSNQERLAEEYGHLTARQAAQIASRVNAKKLILTHFSQRYKDIKDVLNEATDIFPDTTAAYDFMKVEL